MIQELTPVSAAYIAHLLRLVNENRLTVSEALQRAHRHGVQQGKIEGLEIAKGFIKQEQKP